MSNNRRKTQKNASDGRDLSPEVDAEQVQVRRPGADRAGVTDPLADRGSHDVR